ncbi:FAD/NAD(P)-binding protein [Achromobacter xylosoxidans]
MKAIAVAIVGMGPRGLTVLERILEHAHSLPEASRLDIEVFEPGDCGQGVHPAGQSDHLLINTVASQVTMFAPGSVAGGEEGLSLVQWAHLSGYRRHGDRYLRTFEDSGRAITDADHLPRSLLGEYLSWVYRRVVGLLPAHVGVYHHKTRVVDIARHDGGFELALENGARRAADYVFLTTGHGYRKPSAEDRQFLSFVERRKRVNPSLEYYPSPYPIHALAQIPATATVAIQGFGLTAHDVIAALTTGRGGRYVEDAVGDLRYQRSGKEPPACCCSRATACLSPRAASTRKDLPVGTRRAISRRRPCSPVGRHGSRPAATVTGWISRRTCCP